MSNRVYYKKMSTYGRPQRTPQMFPCFWSSRHHRETSALPIGRSRNYGFWTASGPQTVSLTGYSYETAHLAPVTNINYELKYLSLWNLLILFNKKLICNSYLFIGYICVFSEPLDTLIESALQCAPNLWLFYFSLRTVYVTVIWRSFLRSLTVMIQSLSRVLFVGQMTVTWISLSEETNIQWP